MAGKTVEDSSLKLRSYIDDRVGDGAFRIIQAKTEEASNYYKEFQLKIEGLTVSGTDFFQRRSNEAVRFHNLVIGGNEHVDNMAADCATMDVWQQKIDAFV